jgi:hypothetical protein
MEEKKINRERPVFNRSPQAGTLLPEINLATIKSHFVEEFVKYFNDKYEEYMKVATGRAAPKPEGKKVATKARFEKASAVLSVLSASSAVAAIASSPSIAGPVVSGAVSVGTGLLAVLASSGATISEKLAMNEGQRCAEKIAELDYVADLVIKEVALNLSIIFEYQLSMLGKNRLALGNMITAGVNRLFWILANSKSDFSSPNLLCTILRENKNRVKFDYKVSSINWDLDEVYFRTGKVKFSDIAENLTFQAVDIKNKHTVYGYRYLTDLNSDQGSIKTIDEDNDCAHQKYFREYKHSIFLTIPLLERYYNYCHENESYPMIRNYLEDQYENKILYRPLYVIGRGLSFSSFSNLCNLNLAHIDLCYADLTNVDLTNACLDSAYLIGAVLKGANLTKTKLINSCLVGADLTDVILDGANLLGADITGATLLVKSLTKETDLNVSKFTSLIYDVEKIYGAYELNITHEVPLPPKLKAEIKMSFNQLVACRINNEQLEKRLSI